MHRKPSRKALFKISFVRTTRCNWNEKKYALSKLDSRFSSPRIRSDFFLPAHCLKRPVRQWSQRSCPRVTMDSRSTISNRQFSLPMITSTELVWRRKLFATRICWYKWDTFSTWKRNWQRMKGTCWWSPTRMRLLLAEQVCCIAHRSINFFWTFVAIRHLTAYCKKLDEAKFSQVTVSMACERDALGRCLSRFASSTEKKSPMSYGTYVKNYWVVEKNRFHQARRACLMF